MGIKERKERERNERRDSIMRAGMRLYLREGYHAATMEKIAEEAELSRATLYLYFRTMDEIFVNAIVSHSDYFGDLLESVYERRESIGDEILAELWKSFQTFFKKDPDTFNATLYFHQGEMLRNLSRDLRLMLDRSGSRNYRLMCKIVKYGLDRGLFRECNPKTLAEVIYSSFLGIIHLENSKKAMSRKNHLQITWDLAYTALSKGILKDEYADHRLYAIADTGKGGVRK